MLLRWYFKGPKLEHRLSVQTQYRLWGLPTAAEDMLCILAMHSSSPARSRAPLEDNGASCGRGQPIDQCDHVRPKDEPQGVWSSVT